MIFNYIAKELAPLLQNDIVIHDEWADYFAFTDFGAKRLCENTRVELAQSLHPLLSSLFDRTIRCRGKSKSYVPSYVLADSHRNPPLPTTTFLPNSHNSTAIRAALATKLRLSQQSPSSAPTPILN